MGDSLDTIVSAANELYSIINDEVSNQSTKKYKQNDKELTFAELTEWRNSGLPKELSSRYKENKETWLIKDELVLLMDWKLANGKFRPTLPKLIKSNEEKDVESVTKEAFSIFLKGITFKSGKFNWSKASEEDIKQFKDTVKSALKKVCELRGVGPATGSLILSLLTDIEPSFAPPFMSDESFLYYVVEAKRPGTPIKYNVKEYLEELLPVYLDILSKKSDLTFDLLEKGGWSLKSYELQRLFKLANVKIPFEVDEEQLKKYTTGDGKGSAKKESKAKVAKESKKEPIKKEKETRKRKTEFKDVKPTTKSRKTKK
ncbi:uncharacterized protein RJT20DRAFT_36120 [Scheffersomyces xylosifermentans]|uniref:uncharacterized protein n=1 Tax=Scheffersomyces xylosifermentans TaxID=1304137 RepID=UPI00315CF380